jgi:phosphatidylserine/phosphatidylglycerophosphate/cardiolipin synthase-like enzyme
LILHDGLRDTHTFDAQLAMIRHARHELLIVNNFPLVIELQRALVAAIRRGVRVRVLFGSVRPHYAADEPFPGGTIRSIADQLVRARLDPVILAGGEAYEYAITALPHWDARLGQVFPHVHAKLLLRDGKDLAIGSANLDVTAAYWESEVMLVVHDAAYAAGVRHQLDQLFASARPVLGDSDAFRAEAAQRAWLSRYWPSLIG